MNCILYFLSLLGGVALCFGIVDWYSSFMIWQRRIHIGRWNQTPMWRHKVENVCWKWLNHTPTVKMTDQNRLILWNMIKGKYRNSTIQYWQEAGLLLGLLEIKRKESFFFNKYLSRIIDLKTGQWKILPSHVDAALLGYALMKQNWISPFFFRPALDWLYQLILDLKGEQDTVPYRKVLPDVRFVDTLGFICPFLLRYGALFGEEKAIQLAYKQLEEYDQALLYSSSIPSHAYHIKKQRPMGIYDWGRGTGWYIVAITEMFDTQNQYQLPDIIQLKNRILRLGEEMLLYQHPEGGYADMFFNSQGRVESSSSVLVGLLMFSCFTITKEVKYEKATLAIVSQLKRYTQRNGCIDNCQGDTKGIGYYSHTFGYMPFVQGLTLKLSLSLSDENN